jgi:hypothetical protein
MMAILMCENMAISVKTHDAMPGSGGGKMFGESFLDDLSVKRLDTADCFRMARMRSWCHGHGRIRFREFGVGGWGGGGVFRKTYVVHKSIIVVINEIEMLHFGTNQKTAHLGGSSHF